MMRPNRIGIRDRRVLVVDGGPRPHLRHRAIILPANIRFQKPEMQRRCPWETPKQGVRLGKCLSQFRETEVSRSTVEGYSCCIISWIFHFKLMDINESPVYILLNPMINAAQKDLPITIYESGIHSAIKMLKSRITVLHHYLLAMQKGDIPCENSLLRQVSSLLRRLPAIESGKFQDDFLMEYNDTLLITYLAVLTNCSSTTNELVDKFNTAYDRHSRRGGRTAYLNLKTLQDVMLLRVE